MRARKCFAQHTVSCTHRNTRQAKTAATNYILIPEPLDRCDAFLRLEFVVRRKPTNFLKFLVSLMFPHGTRVRSSVDEEGQSEAAMVVRP
jgi:hypothetical protein